MDVPTPSGETLLSAVLGVLGGGGLTKLASMVFGRKSREVHALGEAITTLSRQLRSADERMDGFGERLDRCQIAHEACEEGRRSDRRAFDKRWNDLAKAMKTQPIPAYHINAPKKDPGRGSGR